MISSGLISEQTIGPEIIAAETTAFDLSSNDVIFVKDGSGVNLHAGEHYFIMREMHKVKHPVSGRKMAACITLSEKLKCYVSVRKSPVQ